ncbi:AI-2E family transporter [Bifidobacterium gallicum]|nr:AI-2E family transporter [Bifidobacterium gallicum]KFI59633.1 membrane protein [Bifidobacterium gallicum DSM 20093 = LMG 11596]
MAIAQQRARKELLNDQDHRSKLDLASIFPAKNDPRRPPLWLSRALMYAVIAVFVGYFCYRTWFKISYIVLDIVIALFLSLAVEPLVLRLIRHGWRRGVAAVTCLVGLLLIIVGLMAAFGNLFVQQFISMMKGLPAVYDDLVTTVEQYTKFRLPEISAIGPEILKNVQSSWITNFAGTAVSTAVEVLGGVLNLTTAIMVAFYISIAGPRLRRSVCHWLAPSTQRRFLLAWTVVQDQTSNYLFSRTILAACSATCMAIFLMIIHVPYWLPLALFSGVVSQFVPTIGTYLGGALPVLFAWGDRGIWYAVGVVVFITVYQQIENLLLSPKVSERTMDINPCVAFLTVLFFGSIFGALGAFLALPITASIQVLFKVSTKQYDLVDVPLMSDPEPKRKSRVAQAGEALSDSVSKHAPRAAKGSTAYVPLDEKVRLLQDQIYGIDPTSTDSSGDADLPTVAIPQRNQSHHGRTSLLHKLHLEHDDADRSRSDSEATVASQSNDIAASNRNNNDFSDTHSDVPTNSSADGSTRLDGQQLESKTDGEDEPGPDSAQSEGAGSQDNPRRSWK